jgi:hypothetical protein
VIDEAKCGSASTCLPMNVQTGPALDFRMRRLNVIAPRAFTFDVNPTLQTSIIDGSMDLDAKACAELGTGTFNWLLRIDPAALTLTTGGARHAVDPFNVGYCFDAGAVTSKLVATGAGYQTATPIPKLDVPIYLDKAGTSVLTLPLSAVTMQASVSPNRACIGSLNVAAIEKDCSDDFADCSKWRTGAAIGAYITLEDADAVVIRQLNETLCVVLTETAPAANCARDANGTIVARGDYCSSTGAPGGCKDSFWFAATFAASAVKISSQACP